ncbi:MAG: bifunctional isocitrate dehydrogenase kinase/phosphatase [Gemmatimonadota bacterium]
MKPGARADVVNDSASAAASEAVLAAFDSYHAQFKLVARRARHRFETRDWRGAQRDATERLELYRQFVEWTVRDLQRILGARTGDMAVWAGMKRIFTREATGRPDTELCYTFFNSISRRLLTTVGINADVGFVEEDFERIPLPGDGDSFQRYVPEAGLVDLLRRILGSLPLTASFRDFEGDVHLAARALREAIASSGGDSSIDSAEVVPALFFRNKGAYVIGRLRMGGEVIPLVLPLVNSAEGIGIDAVLTTSDEASVVFSFTRSYFHVETEQPRALIEFLRTIMPLKPLEDLYTALGYNKHGKTELYRALARHLAAPLARFEEAEGDKGLVMSVFALPSFNVVFKIIRDRFGAPKNTTRQAVMDKYHLVFVRDRVGRLADAHEFEGLDFPLDRFHPSLLEELLSETAGSVRVEADRVTVRHLYTERRVVPLNLFLRHAEEPVAVDTILDFGQTIKDLAAANIFTGDMLLKNFGVTRHGRVIFYDYDELCLLTECNFREIPAARHEEDEFSGEPWFHVGERDVFPQEFRSFMVLPGRMGSAFLEAHGDLLTVEFWRRMQKMQEAGEVIDIFPYAASRRLRRD